MIGTVTRLLSPGGARGAHQVLFFHRVLPRPDPLLPGDPDRRAFDALVGSLKRHFTILPLEEALDRLEQDRLPPASLSMTFDDGYADNVTEALPVLRAHEVSATFFITTGYLDGGRMWNDTVIEALRRLPAGELDLSAFGLGRHALADALAARAPVVGEVLRLLKHREPAEREALAERIGAMAGDLPEDLMMTGAQVRELDAAGMGIGAHTVSHPILTRLPDHEAWRELADGKTQLESLLQRPVSLLAYPNGKRGRDYDQRHVAMAGKIGFRAAFSTEPGVSRRGMSLWELPRFTPWDRGTARFTARLLLNRYGLAG